MKNRMDFERSWGERQSANVVGVKRIICMKASAAVTSLFFIAFKISLLCMLFLTCLLVLGQLSKAHVYIQHSILYAIMQILFFLNRRV